MKTLPAAITAGKGGDSERVILTRIIPEDTDAWGELCWATKPVYVDTWGPCSAGEANFVSNRGTLIEDFEDIAPWTCGGGTKEADTVYRRQGNQSIKLTATNGGESIVTKSTNHDMSSMTNIIFWCYVPTWEPPAISPFHRMRILFSNDVDNYFYKELLLNYGSLNWYIRDFKPGWNKIVIPKNVFDSYGSPSWSNSIGEIQFRINARAGEDASVRFDDLRMNYNARAKCMIHFDDNKTCIYTLGKPILDANGQKATSFVNLNNVGVGGCMTIDQMTTLYNNGWDISNHTKTHPILPDCTPEELEEEVNGAYDWFMENGFVRSAKYFAYPTGAYNSTVIAKVKERHVLARSVISDYRVRSYSHIQLRDDNADMLMRADGIGQTETPAIAKEWIDNAIQSKGLITLLFHVLVDGECTPGQPEYNIDDFEEIMDYLKTKEADIDVVTMDEYYNDLVHGGILKEGGFSPIRQSVDIEEGGNVAKVGNTQISVLNPQYAGQDRFDECFEGMNLENRTVEIWSGFYTGSDLQKANLLLRFRGVVDDVNFDYDKYTIKVKDAGFKRHKIIPDLVIMEDNYPRCPEGNLNKIAPLLFGSLYGGTLYLNTFQAIPVFNINKDKPEYMISQNKCDVIINTYMYLFFEEINRWVQIFGSSNFSETYGPPSKIAFPLGEAIKGDLYSQLEKQGSQTDPTSLDFANAVDNDDASYVTLTGGRKLFLFAPIPSQLGGIVNEDSNLILQIRCSAVTGDGYTLKYYNPEYNDGVGAFSTGVDRTSCNNEYIFGDDKSAHGRYPDPDDPKYDKLAPWKLEEIATYEFGLEVKAGASVRVLNLHVLLQNLILKGKFHVRPAKGIRRRTGLRNYIDRLENVEAYCASVHGAEFGAWIDQDSRDNGYDSGHLVQYGAFIVESILRDELDLTSSEIDYESFDDVGNDTDGDRKDWKFAKIVNEAENSINIIGQFCKQAGLIYFQNYENKEKVIALKKRTAGKTIDRTTIQQGTINVRFSHLNQIYNEFYLNYNKHPGNNNFAKTLFVTASDHNLSSNTRSGTPNTFTGLCSDSQDKYLKTNRLTLDCDWIRDDATAELLIKWLAEWLCYRKYIVEFETAGLDHIDLELGDQVKIDHTLLPTGISNDDSFLLYDISDDLNNDKMRFKFMQVPDLLA